MTVRKTESRLPEVLTPADLGHAAPQRVVGARTFTLISYLDHYTLYKNGTLSDNTYVVFVNVGTSTDEYSYGWKVQGKQKETGNWQLAFDLPPSGDGAVFELNRKVSQLIICRDQMSALRVTVTVKQPAGADDIELTLEQPVLRPLPHTAGIFRHKGQHTMAGDPEITQDIADDFGPLLESLVAEPGFDEEKDRRKLILMTALIYGERLRQIGRPQTATRDWERFLNADKDDESLAYTRLGVTGMSPLLLGMFINENMAGGGNPLVTLTLREDAGGDRHDYFKRLYDAYCFQVPEKTLIDVFNLLRFPKGNLRACSILLEGLKARNAAWGNPPWRSFLIDKEKTDHLLDEYWWGPTDETITSMAHETQASRIMATPYVYLSSGTSLCLLLRGDMRMGIPTNEVDTDKQETLDELESITEFSLTLFQDTEARPYPMWEQIFYEATRFTVHLDYHSPDEDRVCMLKVYRHRWTIEDVQPHPRYGVLDPAYENLDPDEEAALLRRLNKNAIREAYTATYSEASTFYVEVGPPYEAETTAGTPAEVRARVEQFANRIALLHEYQRAAKCLGMPVSEPILAFLEPFRDLLDDARRVDIIEAFKASWLSDALQHSVSPHLVTVENEQVLDEDSLFGALGQPVALGTLGDVNASAVIDVDKYELHVMDYMSPLSLEFKLDQPSLPSTDSSAGTGTASPTADDVLARADDLQPVLDTIWDWVNRSPKKLRLVIVGYADRSYSGSGDRAAYNLALSERRANWFWNQVTQPLRDLLSSNVEIVGCGDKYSELPEKNKVYRDVRIILVPEES
jgi:hypothetical protein